MVRQEADGTALIYIDRHLVHEVTSPQAFEGLKLAGRKLWRTASILAVVCGDSHTSTHGAFAALAFRISTSEVEHVMATQCLLMKKAKAMQMLVEGVLGRGGTNPKARPCSVV